MIGRERERKIFNDCIDSDKSELITVLGRRRVGKTYLIRKACERNIVFEVIGIQNGTIAEQMNHFAEQLKTYFNFEQKKKIITWLQAFALLKTCLEKSKKKSKKVLFFDEVPWLGESSKRKFIEALGHFWNTWAVNNNIVIILCGSAASWIVKHVVNSKGSMYNRVTKKIMLQPFTLYEVDLFLKAKGMHLDEYQIMQLYMALGGIPHYLDQVQTNKSIAENLTDICFDKLGLLHDEFDNLYKALFTNHNNYIAVIRSLAQSKKGLTRQEIINATGLTDGGSFTQILKDLVQCDFIIEQHPFSKRKRDIQFRLIDEFSLFYLRFVDGQNTTGKTYWQQTMGSQIYKIWSGYAFENICFRHQDQILKATKLEAILTSFSSFYIQATDELPGTQIDMVLDRADGVVNLFEIKFYKEPVIITNDMAQKLRTKIAVFKASTLTKKQVFVSMISIYGTVPNKYSNGILAHDISGRDLMVK